MTVIDDFAGGQCPVEQQVATGRRIKQADMGHSAPVGRGCRKRHHAGIGRGAAAGRVLGR